MPTLPRRASLLLVLAACAALIAGEHAVGLVLDDRYKAHLTGPRHPEQPARIDAIAAGLRDAGLTARLLRIAPRVCEPEHLFAVHTREYVKLVQDEIAAGNDTLSTGDTPLSPATYDTALLAAGGVLAACDAVMAGQARRAFCAVRPPGHHAMAARGKGFCVFHNVAIAARYLLGKHGLKRVLIVDWDVHHGDGTWELFKAEPAIFQFQYHQAGIYPGTGRAEDVGEGAARGNSIHLMMPAGTGDAEAERLFRERLPAAMAVFRPEAVLISCGFDAYIDDPIGGLALTAPGYAALTRIVCAVADRHAQGRVISVLEGGYALPGIGQCAAAHVTALMEPAQIAVPQPIAP